MLGVDNLSGSTEELQDECRIGKSIVIFTFPSVKN